jgi:GTP-binding protein
MFVDRAKIRCVGGKGGDGALSFRREKFVEMGGPDGGNGGPGGSVWLEADGRKNTLYDIVHRPLHKAEDGRNGGTAMKTGATGEDYILSVPPGTLVFKNDKLVADLKNQGDRLLIAKGGRSGRGNASFKTIYNTAPHISEKGDEGEEADIFLELKLLADVGLVGFPNAGKSTFLSRVTKARPKIADYPFTTLTPNLGVCAVEGKSFVVADIPGLIEGAHAGKGLGDEFLRHVERTRVLVHLVDVSGFDGKAPHETFKALNKELKLYSAKLAEKPQIVAATKLDVTESADGFAELKKKLKKTKIYPISAVTGEGVEDLLHAVAKALDDVPEAPMFIPEKAEYIIAPDFTITRTPNGAFHVAGRKVNALAARTHFHQDESVARIQKILKKMGVEQALIKKGAKLGDKVVLGGEAEFTFRPDD